MLNCWQLGVIFSVWVAAGKLIDKIRILAVGFPCDLAMCLPAKGWHFVKSYFSTAIFFESIELLW